MKKIALATLTLFAAINGFAQHTTGKVIYKETVKLNLALQDIKLEGEASKLAEMLPKEQSFSKELYFTDAASIYKMAPKTAEENSYNQGGPNIKINMNVPQDIVYRDIKENKLVSQKDFMSRKFLVTSDGAKREWKMTGKQKTLLGFPCQEATMMAEDSQKVSAWFTPAIPVSTGPSEAGGLPGLILALHIGKVYEIEAVSVDFKDIDTKVIAKPTQGKKMSKKEFDAVMAEKRKEMGDEGGNGNLIIKVQRH